MTTPRFSRQLDAKMRLCSPVLVSALDRFWGHPDLARLFPSRLFRMHCEARATVHLLGAAMETLSSMPEDPLSAPLLKYLTRLRDEEEGHDDWVLKSLEALDFSRSEVLARVPSPTTAAMVGAQYYWIYHHHPVALLGFIKVAENDPPTHAAIEDVMKRSGLPRGAFTYHLGHVALEPEHNAALDEMLDTLPLTEAQKTAIGVNVIQTVSLLARGVEESVVLFEASQRDRMSAPAPDERRERSHATDVRSAMLF